MEAITRNGVTMLRLLSADKIKVGDKGVWTFHSVEGLNPRGLEGQLVEVDGEVYRVHGVETFAIAEPINQPFGLWLKPVAATEGW
jgi:hypothetical protein